MARQSVNIMQLDERVRCLAQDLGTDFYGIADLSLAHDFILNQGGPDAASYPGPYLWELCCSMPSLTSFPGERRGQWRLSTDTMPMML